MVYQRTPASPRTPAGIPVVTAGAGAGTSPPTPTLTAESDDWAGCVLAGSGTSPAAGFIAHVAFSITYPTIPKSVNATPGNIGTTTRQVYVANVAANGFDLGMGVAPNASQSVGVYRLQYTVDP